MAKEIIEVISKKGYHLLRNLEDEKDALWSFENEYDGSTYLCDAITEISDSAVPIYTNDIWENAKNIKEHIEEAVSQGLTEGVTDIEKIMQAGYYQFYSQSLYDNLDIMVYNIMARKVNEFLNTKLRNLDVDAIEEFLNEKSENYDNNDTYDDIQEIVDEVIQGIKNNEYDLGEK